MTWISREARRTPWSHSTPEPPKVGQVVADNRYPWRILSVETTPPAKWTPHDEETWVSAGRPDIDTWPRRPITVTATRDDLPNDKPARARRAAGSSQGWQILPEHYSICHRCGELPPCREQEESEAMARRVDLAEKRMNVPGGACPGCAGPITTRQKTIEFLGENVWNPLDTNGSVRFHARLGCRIGAAAYEEAWHQVDPENRPRSVLTLKCTGTLTVHGTGAVECHGRDAEQGECPSVHAYHSGMFACHTRTEGCASCITSGRHGVKVRPDLLPDGRLPDGSL